MSKAILVMDMPECCEMCRFNDYEPRCRCRMLPYGEAKIEDRLSKLDNCPLRKLPEKKPEKILTKLGKYASTSVFKLSELNIGFNACLDTIEGSGEHD